MALSSTNATKNDTSALCAESYDYRSDVGLTVYCKIQILGLSKLEVFAAIENKFCINVSNATFKRYLLFPKCHYNTKVFGIDLTVIFRLCSDKRDVIHYPYVYAINEVHHHITNVQ